MMFIILSKTALGLVRLMSTV